MDLAVNRLGLEMEFTFSNPSQQTEVCVIKTVGFPEKRHCRKALELFRMAGNAIAVFIIA